MKMSKINDLLFQRPDFDQEEIRKRILEFESRSLWISSELNDPENQILDTCKYSSDMLQSLEDEMNLLNLLANVMYRRMKQKK